MANNEDKIKRALANAVATRSIDDATIERTVKHLSSLPIPIKRIDVCTVGICLDFLVEPQELPKIPDLIRGSGPGFGGIEVFPFGIVEPDLFRVRLNHNLDISS